MIKSQFPAESFPISVKGILKEAGRFLLRKNERAEYELLGGRLEKGDHSLEERLRTEFLEESGIEIQARQPLEPWVLAVGQSCVLILPYRCRVLRIPDILFDQDGGSLTWFEPQEIDNLPMPQGYKDSLFALAPHSSISQPAMDSAGWIKGGEERRYSAFVQLWKNEEVIQELPLPRFTSPRELLVREIKKYAGRLMFEGCQIDQKQKAVILCYRLNS